jgi:hypothetical protein
MQTASDPFLGWGTNPRGDHIDVRQFRDWKASVEVSQLDGAGLKDYGKLCGWALAEADYRLLLEAVAAGRIPTARPSLNPPLSKGGKFSTPLHSGS